MIRIGRFLVQTPLGALPGLGIQPHYKVPGHFWVEIVKMEWLTSGKWGCPLANGPKLAVGQPNRSKKISFNLPQFQRHIRGCLNNIKVCHSCWGYVGYSRMKFPFLSIAQVIPETKFWLFDWYQCVSPWYGKFGTLEYSRMNVPFHNVGGVILIFW